MTKTKKTLMKRVKITKNGKIMHKQTRLGHLKRKMDASRKGRKNTMILQTHSANVKRFKNLLSKAGRRI
jgi:ribosomal protein L35